MLDKVKYKVIRLKKKNSLDQYMLLLYLQGSKQEEPLYATPTFKMSNYRKDQTSEKELHYMVSSYKNYNFIFINSSTQLRVAVCLSILILLL